MNEEKTLTVTISGRVYELATDEQADVVSRAVDRLNTSLSLVGDTTGGVGGAAILTALHFAVELTKQESLLENQGSKVKELLALLP